MEPNNLIIYNTVDGKTSVALMAKDGNVWLNQQMLAELFDTSKQNISLHIINVLNDKELDANSVVKDYLTTAADGKQYNVTFYSPTFCHLYPKHQHAHIQHFKRQRIRCKFSC